MSKIHTIQAGDEKFNLCEATAPKQRELLGMVGSRIAINQAATGVDIDVNLIVGTLITMTDQQLQSVSDIVLWKTAVNGKDSLVDVDYFQSNMSGYLMLIAGGVKANLQDFFDYLESASRAARTAQPQA